MIHTLLVMEIMYTRNNGDNTSLNETVTKLIRQVIIRSCSTPIISSRMSCSRRIETNPKGLRNEPVVDITFYPVDSQIERAT